MEVRKVPTQREIKRKEAFEKLAAFDQSLRNKGFISIAGVDEAGRGCLAGPLVAASVILPPDFYLEELKECKQLSPKKREELFEVICDEALSYSVVEIPPKEIDEIRINFANLKALMFAVINLKISYDYVLCDGFNLVNVNAPVLKVIKGDMVSLSIAAASIVAKVHRDRLMIKISEKYPQYGFEIHKGYGTSLHLEALKTHGPSDIHRYSFSPVKQSIKNQGK